MKKTIIIIFLLTGCSYFVKKDESPFSSLKISYQIKVENSNEDNSLLLKKSCFDVYRGLNSILSKGRALIDDNCFLYLTPIKEKVDNKNGIKIASYRFEVDARKLVEDLKARGLFNGYGFKVLMRVDEEVYKLKNLIDPGVSSIEIKQKGENYNLNDYDFVMETELSTSWIKTSISSLYFSSFTATIINTQNMEKTGVIKAQAISNDSPSDSIKKLISEVNKKIFENKKFFEIGYYRFKFLNYHDYAYISSIVDFLDKNNLRFFVISLNSKVCEIGVYKKDNRKLEEIVSLIVKSEKNLYVDLIDGENNIVVLYFNKSDLNII